MRVVIYLQSLRICFEFLQRASLCQMASVCDLVIHQLWQGSGLSVASEIELGFPENVVDRSSFII